METGSFERSMIPTQKLQMLALAGLDRSPVVVATALYSFFSAILYRTL